MELSNQQVSELKKELIDAYKNAGKKNCLGSVEKTVEELFELRNDMVKKEVINFKGMSFNETVKFRPR